MRLSPDLKLARRSLKDKGWSYRKAAPYLGVHYSHLCLVLTGKRVSRSLINRIVALSPSCEKLTRDLSAA